MSDSNTPFVDPNTDDLNDFNSLLHGHAKELVEEEKIENETPPEATEEETETDEEISEDDTLATDDDDEDEDTEEEEQEEEKPAPEKRKSRYQERIDDLTAKAREAERRERELRVKLDEVIAKLDNKDAKPSAPVKEEEDKAPDFDEKNEDGTDKYPLGEFDPNYIRDLVRYENEKQKRIMQAEMAKEKAEQEERAAREALQSKWQEKLTTVLPEYPDFIEKGAQLEDAFRDLDPQYSQYLAATIMSMDYGPHVLYHLASNAEEARKIVAAGPTGATIALGRLEALYEFREQEAKRKKETKKLKVSEAPEPPERLNKGNSVATEVPDDTDDLDAFSMKLFASRKGKR